MVININIINQTNIILIVISITYYVLSRFCLPKGLSVTLASNVIWTTKNRRFLMRYIWSSFCKCRILGNNYQSNIEWVPYHRKVSHYSNSLIPTVKQSCSQNISLTLEFYCCSALAPGIQNNDSTMWFYIFLL